MKYYKKREERGVKMIYAIIKLMKTNVRILIDKIEFIIIRYDDYYILQKINSKPYKNKPGYIYRTKKIENIREEIINSFIKEHNNDITTRYGEIILIENDNIEEKVLHESINRNFWQEYKDEYLKDFKKDLNTIIQKILEKKDIVMCEDTDNYKVKCIINNERMREERQSRIRHTDNDITRRLPVEIVDMICDYI